MQYKSGNQIREDFLRFFETKEHRRVHSSSLVPQNDPTLLFTNAGMNQFKDVFLGAERREYSRAVSSQKCVRAGGKHNDLENVGFTRRHHTFFEMLGNFSFGDYFKREAIAYAWELLTSPQWFGIDPAKLYVTIFEGDASVPRDDEAERLWIETGVPAERIFAMPGKDNFWQMGETGPCGPSSEIFYDLGIEASETGEDKPFPQDDQRYVEIWNLVFMQFDRKLVRRVYRPDEEGKLKSVPGKLGELGITEQTRVVVPTFSDFSLDLLPKPSIDTGMGLERIACVLQGVLSNYQTDLFTPLIARAAELTGFTSLTTSEASVSDAKAAASLRIIADHARAATFLISDGVVPANEGRGYVLRKILRRGIRHGRILGQEEPFMCKMVLAVRDEMQVAYPELAEAAPHVAQVVLAEEEQFARVMDLGMKRLDDEFLLLLLPHNNLVQAIIASPEEQDFLYMLVPGSSPMPGETMARRIKQLRKRGITLRLSGSTAFKLYETYGLPLDFMVDAARDAGIEFDMAGFEAAKEEEQARARASWKGGSQKSASPAFRELPKTEFEGYTALRVDGARILALVKDGLGVPALGTGETGEAVLDATSFYADSGGQVGDIGHLYSADHNTIVADVLGATKPVQGVFAHKITARQPLAVGDIVDTVVDRENRLATERNHTGTHLLHAALREVLGPHVKQAGSLNDPTRLRFDFSHFAAIAEPELREIESIVNSQVLANTKVETLVDVPIDVAVNELGAMALFGEKYGDKVRVVKIGGFSTELCGGTHTAATGEIGLIKITGENSVSSGVRRVEALSGTGALAEFRRDFELSRTVAQLAGSGDPEALRHKLSAQEEELKKLRRELDQVRMKAASASVSDAASSAVEVKGVKVLAQRVDALDKSQMRDLVDQLRTKLGSGVVVLGAASPGEAGSAGKVTLIVGVTKDLTSKLQAGKIVGLIAAKVGGKGGGRPDLAEAGGNDPSALDAALTAAPSVVESFL
jgi:alanyl-tRNA synthetase